MEQSLFSREQIDQFKDILYAQSILAKNTFIKKIKPLMHKVLSKKTNSAHLTLRFGGASITHLACAGSIIIDLAAKLSEKKYGLIADRTGQITVNCNACASVTEVGQYLSIFAGENDHYILVLETEPQGFKTRVRIFRYESFPNLKLYTGPIQGQVGVRFSHNIGELIYFEDMKIFK